MDGDEGERPLIGDRIVVIGNTSSGKSTLGKRLAEVIGGKHIELDGLFWLPEWQQPETADFHAKVREAIAGERRWASSGNYIGRGMQEVLWPLADTLIWLDMPLRVVLPRVTARSWRRWRDDELLWGTNREEGWRHLKLWDPEESLISFAVRYHRPKQREYATYLEDPRWAELRKYRLRSPRAVEAFVARCEEQAAARPVGG